MFVPSQKVLAITADPVSKSKETKRTAGIGDVAQSLPFHAESWFVAWLKPQSQLSPGSRCASSCLLSDDFSTVTQTQQVRGQQVIHL